MADITVTISAVDKTSPVLIKISGAAKKAGADLESAGAKGRKGLEDIEKGGKKADTALRTFERTSLAVGATVGALALGLVKVSAAYAQQERQLAAVTRLYGEAGDEILQYAEAIQDTTRFSNDAARQSAIVLNTLTANYGLAQSQIETLISRSADLAALHGKTLEEVSQMVSNALRGEGEYIEQIGVTMNQTFIAAEAAARGLGNFITEMSAAEQAAFRYTVFLEQTAAAQGYAMETATGARGAFGLLANEVQDAAQSFGSFLGPVADVAAQFNAYALWLPLIASQTARVSAIMINSARSGQIMANSLGVLRFAISPLGLLIGGLVVAAGAMGMKFLEQKQAMAQAAAQAEATNAAYTSLNDTISNFYVGGNTDAARWAEQQTAAARDFITVWQEAVDEGLAGESDGWWESLVENVSHGFGAVLQSVELSIAPGMADFANSFGRAFSEVGDDVTEEFLRSMQLSPAEEASIYNSLNRLFNLANNPNIDLDHFQAETTAFFDQLWIDVAQGIVPPDQIDTEIDQFFMNYARNLQNLGREWQSVADEIALDRIIDDLKLDDMGHLEASIRTFEQMADRLINVRQSYVESARAINPDATFGDLSYLNLTAAQIEVVTESVERLRDAMMTGDFKNNVINTVLADLEQAFVNREITAEEYVIAIADIANNLSGLRKSGAEAAEGIELVTDKMQRFNREAAESFKEDFFANMADNISTYLDAFNMSDPVSLINLSSLRNEFTALAGDIATASSQLETVFRVIVSNTDAFKQQAQGVHDWIDSLTEAEEGVRRIDTLIQGGYIDKATYQGAIDAHEAISAAQIEIANNVDAIQTMQAPFIAQFVQNQATILESLRGQDAAQQRVTLGWMDATTAAQAYTLMQQAVAVGNGELGETGELAFKSMIEGAVAVNPFLFDMLETIGLISGTPLDFEVNFDGVTEGMTEIEMLTLRIEDLVRALGGTLTPIDLEVNGLDKVEDANRSVNELLANKLREIAINITANFDEGSGPIADILAGRAREMAPLLIPVEYDYSSLPDPSMDSKRLLDPIKVPVEFDYEDLPDPSAGQALTIPVELDLMGTVDDVIPEDTTVTITFEPDTSELYSMIEVISGGDISGPKFTFTYDSTDVTTAATTLAGANYSGPTFDFQPNDDAVNTAASTVARNNWFGPTFLFQANTSSLQAVINQYAGRTLATSYIDVQVRQTGSINVPGQLPTTRRAHGGILFEGAEVGPEVLHFAGGGVSTIREPGLYMAPPNTYISPANANRGSDGGNTYVYSQNAPVYGVDDLHEEFRKFAMAMANENTRHRLAAGVS